MYLPGMVVAAAARRPNPEAARRTVGLSLYVVLLLAGAFLLFGVFVIPALMSKRPDDQIGAMGLGMVCALPPLVVYLWLPWIIDRFDPEPWWCLLMALLWGAIGACGIAGFLNTIVDGVMYAATGSEQTSNALTACFSAPLVEEFWKGIGVFGFFYFLRREFDGVVDGIIYATFIALGFAATENVVYYARAILDPHANALAQTFVLRGILGPWGHPLYTSMTGIGFGIARESTQAWKKWLAPFGGYCLAVAMHFTWNAAGTISSGLFIVMLPLWFMLVLGFLAIVIVLVRRKGKIIRQHLQDEVLLGNLTRWELDLVCSPVGRLRATFGWGGGVGRQFIRTAARLGLSKWHTVRAQKGRARTVSVDFIVPLRQELFQLREQIGRMRGGRIERPQAWTAPPAQQPAMQPAYAQQQPHAQQQWGGGGGGGWGQQGGGGPQGWGGR
jgi:RsiW-degrading membrane proteinase PrsW (M82 family)